MAYRALYREWRPRDFSHVVGQKAIIDTLRNQVITRRIAHAYLFCGSRGTGKTSTAKILAKAINCENPKDGDPCGVCPNCLRADMEETLDVIEIDAASNNGVDEIRDLRDTVKYPPQYGTYKVYIIDEVHMLSTSAFNALLKTLEEPPEHIVFILATTEPQKLPETILSRCQRFDFGRISVNDIEGRLKEAADGCGAHVTDGALMLIARFSEGGMRDALSLLDMCLGYSNQVDETLVRSILGTSDSSFLFEFSDALADTDAGKVFHLIDRLMRDGKDPAVFARDMCRHIRALLIAKLSPEETASVMDISGEEGEEYRRHAEDLTVSRLMKILELFMSLDNEMRYASTPRIALENAALKCCLKMEETDEQTLSDRITELENKLNRLTNLIRKGSLKADPASADADKDLVQKPAESAQEPVRQQKSSMKIKPGADAEAAWKEMMSTVQRSDISLWSFLSQGKLISAADHHYRWRANVTDGEEQYISLLNRPEKAEMLSSKLSEITGEKCDFMAVGHQTDLPAGEESDDVYMKKIYETFGQGPVDIIE